MIDQARTSERLLWALQERAKELGCLYQVEELLNNPETSLEQVFVGVIRAIPPGWQYPEVCKAAIEFEGATYNPDGFVGTPWVQSAPIVVQDREVGRIFIEYEREMPQADDGPFLKEEGKLVHTIADRLGHFILHQKLRALVQDISRAQESLSQAGTDEWRVLLNLLRRTDRDVYVRVSRKMANHLSWSGVSEAQSLLHGFAERREEESEAVGEKNQPSQRMPIDSSLELSDRVFRLAGAYLPGEEILASIQRWIHEDRASFLLKTVVSPQSSPAEIADAIRRYQRLVPAGTGISPTMLNIVRVNLVRRFLSEEPAHVSVAKSYIGLDDMLLLLERLIYLPGSEGRVGGKAAGLLLASRILGKDGGADLAGIRTPKTWYIASDAVHGFVRHNNLEEVYEQKYKDIGQVRMEYPNLVQVFKNSQFPPEVVKGLSVALDDLHEGPIIVRSSSLLEDRLGAAFSGKYKSLFLPNIGSKSERLAALLDAVAEVYASTFGPDPIQYRLERGLVDLREEMGIMIQEVVGCRAGRFFFPAFAGVAVSHNEFRWSARIRREDGLIRMVPGLGTRAVDRVRDDYPVLIAPGQPRLRVNVTPDEVVRYSPRYLDVIDLESRSLETVDVASVLRECGEAYPGLHDVISVHDGAGTLRPAGFLLDLDRDEPVVTFDGLTQDTPFVHQVAEVLRTLAVGLSHPVEIEFASDGASLTLLQCRPQSHASGAIAATIPSDLPAGRVLFSANRYVSNGRVPDITHIVYVDPDRYEELAEMGDLLGVGRAVSRLNMILPKRQFILMGPGRWGSRGDIKLGVHVTYSDISNTAVLVEIARRRDSVLPDLSFGTHFFQDLAEAAIRYLPLYPDDEGVRFNEAFFRDSPNELAGLIPELAHLAAVVRVIDVPRASGGLVLRVLMNAEQDRAVGLLGEQGGAEEEAGERPAPRREAQEDHWRWRLRMAERLAAQLDAERFGVRAMYVLGSTKNATAGPESDIDLLVHFVGNEEQRAALQTWLEGWSLCLDEMSYLRTGSRAGGMLDVHYITDRDIAERSSFAIKIGAVTDAAWPLRLGSSSNT